MASLYEWPIKDSVSHIHDANSRNVGLHMIIPKIRTRVTQSDRFSASHMHNISFTCCNLVK